ncbi:mycofactocin precursor MftA [Streptomyces sp. NPDC059627]
MDELQLEETDTAGQDVTGDAVIEADDLVEEVSIDGMCGVY